MNWDNIDVTPEENDHTLSPSRTKQNNNIIHQQNELKRLAQLRKLESSKNTDLREAYKESITKFGELLVSNSMEEIASSLMDEDCEVFLFAWPEKSPAQYAFKHKGFMDLYQGYRIIQREIKETYVDLEKTTAFQICYCTILNEKENSTKSQFSFEVFSFKKEKISKYRVIFGNIKPPHDPHELFKLSRKETMLAKIKELNKAWTDQPDLERIASFFHEKTEYKIWRWKDKQCFTFHKHNFASEFKRLEDDFLIKSTVPYDPACEGQYIVGSYVFYLEGKGELSGQKFMWLSTSICSFDQDLNISKINQQGELFDEDEISIPFEVYSKEKIKEKVESYYSLREVSLMNSEDLQFSFNLGVFGSNFSTMINGLNEFTKLAVMLKRKDWISKPVMPVDIFLDLDDPCYDTAITIGCAKGTANKEDIDSSAKLINFYSMRKYTFENGKLVKILVFASSIPEPIPSPYDDSQFVCQNIRPKNEFM